MFLSHQNSYVEILGRGTFGRCEGPQGRGLIIGLSALTKEIPKRLVSPKQEHGYLYSGSGPSPGITSLCASIMDFASSRATRSERGLFVSHPADGILLQQSG